MMKQTSVCWSEDASCSIQSGSVCNHNIAASGSFGKGGNLASPAGSVHVPLSSALIQPLAAEHVAPQIQSLVHMRPSSDHGAAECQPVTAAALGCSAEEMGAGKLGRNPSLAVSVANTINVQARPTSTQEGAETPNAASDDDTIEMGAQGVQGSRHGRSKRLRSNGIGRGDSGTPAAARDVAGATHKATRSLPVAAQVPADATTAGPSSTPKKSKPASEAAMQPAACVTRRPATRSLVQRAALLAQDMKLRNGHALEPEKTAAMPSALEADALAASPRAADACDASKPSAAAKVCQQGVPAADGSTLQCCNPASAEALADPEQNPPQYLEVAGRTTGSNELQEHQQSQPAPDLGPSPFVGEFRSEEGQQIDPQVTYASNPMHCPRGTAVHANSAERSQPAAHAHETSPQAAPGDKGPHPSTTARRSSRAKGKSISATAPSAVAARIGHNHNHHVSHEAHGSMPVGTEAGEDPGACRSAVHQQCAEADNVAEAAALHREAVAEGPVVPEPQPAACTVPLQPPQLTSCERGPRTSRLSPAPQASGGLPYAPGEAGEAHAGAPPGHEEEDEYWEVQQGTAVQHALQGGCGMELSVEQRRVVEGRGEQEEGGGEPVGRADAIIGDGIVGAATEDLEMKMSVDMGMEVNCGWATRAAELGGEQCEMLDTDLPGGGRADAVIMQARGDDGEEEVQAKGEHGIASSCGVAVQGQAAGDASCENPGHGHNHIEELPNPLAEEAGGAAMHAAAAAAVSGTLGRAAADKTWRGPPGTSPPQVSESGSGNAGQQDLCDNESEAFQGSAGAAHEVADRAHSAVPGPERWEGVGEVMGHRMHAGNNTHIPREEGEGEVGAASREASRGQADSVHTPSGYHADSLQRRNAQRVGGGHATSCAVTGGEAPMSCVADATLRAARKNAGNAPAWWERGACDVAAVQQGEGEGEIAGPVFGYCSVPRSAAPNEAMNDVEGVRSAGDCVRRQEEHLSRAGGGASQHQRNVRDAGAMNDVADSGQHRQRETVVESTLHVPADSLQPTGSRTGDALPQIVGKLATRAVSGAGANFSAADDPDRSTRGGHAMHHDAAVQPLVAPLAHQASVKLTVRPHGSSGAPPAAQFRATGLHMEPRGHTLSRVGSVENVPLEGAGLSVTAMAAVGRDGVAPLLLAGVSRHAAPQLDARTSGTGCAVTAAMRTDAPGGTTIPTARQSLASHRTDSPACSEQRPPLATGGGGTNSVTPNTLFPFLPLTSHAMPPHLSLPAAASPPFLFASTTSPSTCNTPPLLPADPYTILSSLLPQQRLPCSPTVPLPYTAAPGTDTAAAQCAGPVAIATVPPHQADAPLPPASANGHHHRVSALECLHGQSVLEPPNGIHAPVNSASLAAAAMLPPMAPALQHGVHAGRPCPTVTANGVVPNAAELPQLLQHLPGHLQSWLQELCKEDARAGQLLQALQATAAAQCVASTTALQAAEQHTSTAAPDFLTSSHCTRLPGEPTTAPATMYPASFIHAMQFNNSNLMSPGPLASHLLAAVPPALNRHPPGSAAGAVFGTNHMHDVHAPNNPGVSAAPPEGLTGLAPLSTQPLATLLNALGNSTSRDMLSLLLPHNHIGAGEGAPAGTGSMLDERASHSLGAPPSSAGNHTHAGEPAEQREASDAQAKRGHARGSVKRQRGGPPHTDMPPMIPVAAQHNSTPEDEQGSPAQTAAKRLRACTRSSPVREVAVPAGTGGPVATRASTSAAAAAIALNQQAPAAHNLTALISSSNAAAAPPHAPQFASPQPSPGRGHTHSAAHRAARHAARNASTTKPGGGCPRSPAAEQHNAREPEAVAQPAQVSEAAGTAENALTDVMAALLDLRSTSAEKVPATDTGDTGAPEGGCSGTALTPTQRAVLEKRLGAVFESLRMDPDALQQALQVALFNSEGVQ